MTDSENEQINSSPKKRDERLVIRLSFIYFFLMLINIFFFWISIGSNQMRLIAEKASVAAQIFAGNVSDSLSPVFENIKEKNYQADKIDEKLKAQILKSFSLDSEDSKGNRFIKEFIILNTENQVLLNHSTDNSLTLPADSEIAALKAVSLNQLKNQGFYAKTNLLQFNMQMYIPLTNKGQQDIVLYTLFQIPEVKAEVFGLIRLGSVMVVLLLLVQVLVGVVIYRTLVRPIEQVSRASVEISQGNFTTVSLNRKQNDEIHKLLSSFNHMSGELKSKTETITENLKELRKKDAKMDYELSVGKDVQDAILPDKFSYKMIDAAVYYEPLYQVSGDFYDFIDYPDGSTGFLIADASGHGVPAAFLTIMTKIFLAAYAMKIDDPGKLLEAMNSEIANYFEGSGKYLTCFYGRIYSDGIMKYCNCMHPEPIIFNVESKSQKTLESQGFFLGIAKEPMMPFVTQQIEVTQSDRIILYTDGIDEAPNAAGEMLGKEAIIEFVQSANDYNAKTILDSVVEGLNSFTAGHPASDDTTCIVLTVNSIAKRETENAEEFFEKRDYEKAFNILSANLRNSEDDRVESEKIKMISLAAECLIRDKKFSETVEFLEEYKNSVFENARLTGRMALAYIQIKNYKAAISLLNSSRNRYPDDANAPAYLALAFAGQGDQVKATEYLEIAQEKNSQSKIVKQVALALKKKFDDSDNSISRASA